MTFLKNILGGGGSYKTGQLQQFTPEQMNLFKQMFGQVGPESFTSRLAMGDQGAFAQSEAPAQRQFAELQGGLASRFSGMGSFGGRRSSGFQNASNAAAQDFAGQLAARRMDLQRQAIQDLFGMSHNLLSQRPYENYLMQPRQNFLQQLLGGAAGGLGQGIGTIGTAYGLNRLNLLNSMQHGSDMTAGGHVLGGG